LTIDRSINNISGVAIRATSEERREQVIAAAVKEFAANGFHATSTGAIAKRAGISQPYIYALFPNKHELFLAVHRHVVDRIRRAFLEAARGGATPEDRLSSMGHAYVELLADRDEILVQMQAHAAAGDPALREPVRQEFLRLTEDVRRMSGASMEQVVAFFAKGMLLNVVAALELPDEFVPGSEAEASASDAAPPESAAAPPESAAAPPESAAASPASAAASPASASRD
jgi:AcrR family transcriptional regulator